MKRLLLATFGAAAIALASTGCTSTHVSQYSAPLEVKVVTEKPPTVEVGESIKGEATIHRLLFFFSWGSTKFADGVNYQTGEKCKIVLSNGFSNPLFVDSVANGEAAAAYNACVDNKADVLIVPRYTIVDDDYFVYSKTHFVVTGFKGTLKNIQK